MASFNCKSCSNHRDAGKCSPLTFPQSSGIAAATDPVIISNHGSLVSAKSGRSILAEIACNNDLNTSPVFGLQHSGDSALGSISIRKIQNSTRLQTESSSSSPVGENLLRSQARKLLQRFQAENNCNPMRKEMGSLLQGERSPTSLAASTPFNTPSTTPNFVPYRRSRFYPQQDTAQKIERSTTLSEITISESVLSGCDNRVLQLSPLLTEAVDVTRSADVFLGKRVLQFGTPRSGRETLQRRRTESVQRVYGDGDDIQWSVHDNTSSPAAAGGADSEWVDDRKQEDKEQGFNERTQESTC